MDTVEILRKLVSFETESIAGKDYEECANFIAESLRNLGFETKIVDGGDGTRAKPNVMAEKNTGEGNTILYSSHFDVVPVDDNWHTDPWQLTERDGKLFGRGSSDDKGAIAAFLSAMADIEPKVGIKVLFTCDEEIGGEDGLGFITKNYADWLKDVSLAWIADSSTEFVGIGSSGVLGGKIVVHGKGGHAGYPHKANNAVHRLLEFLTEIREYEKIAAQKRSVAKSPPNCPYPEVWGRFSITMLSAGVKTNVIPETAEARFDLRFLPEEKRDDVKKEFKNFFEKIREKTGIDARLEFLYGHQGYLQEITPAVERFRAKIERAFEDIGFAAELGGNDGPFLHNLGIPTIAFGAIDSDSRFHMPDEFIRIETLKKMVEAIKEVYTN